jgi:hypothetical protein
MSDIQKRLEDYLNDRDDTDYYPEDDTIMLDRMIEFIINLDSENLNEDQMEELTDIIDDFADDPLDDDEDEDDVEEAISAKKVKIKPSDKRRRRMEYRRKRAAIKMKAKKFRRTTKYKQWSRMKKRKASSGKTARGKRIRKFL